MCPRDSRSLKAEMHPKIPWRVHLKDHGARTLLAIVAVLFVLLMWCTWLITRDQVAHATGRLMVLSVPPGATVILDGLEVGRTPMTLDAVVKGRHSLQLVLQGFDDEQREVIIEPGREHPVHLILQPVSESPEPALEFPR